MAIKSWRKLLRWKVHGRRYDEGRGHQGIELDDLVVLVELRRALVELTKAIWKRQRNRAQMPRRIDEDIDLRVQRFEGGSLEAEVSLGIPLHEHVQTSLIVDVDEFGERDDVVETFFDAAHMLKSILHTKQLPKIPGFTPIAVGEMLKALEERELRLELDVIGTRRAIRLTPIPIVEDDVDDSDEDSHDGRERIPRDDQVFTFVPRRPIDEAARVARPTRPEPAPEPEPPEPPRVVIPSTPGPAQVDQEGAAELRRIISEAAAADEQRKLDEERRERRTISGEVRAVDIDETSAKILLDGTTDKVVIRFAAEDEERIARALLEHGRLRVRARGEATIGRGGRIRAFEAHAGQVRAVAFVAPDPNAPSEELFASLAKTEPAKLLPYLHSPATRPGLLAIAAELAGEHLPEAEVVPPLFALLDHASAIVREAAIYGLMHHDLRERSTVLRKLTDLSKNDPNPGVRIVAEGALADWSTP